MRPLRIYADASVIGGCEDAEFAADSRVLWDAFVSGRHLLVLSTLTVAELRGAPAAVRNRVRKVPDRYIQMLGDSTEAQALADAYLARGIVGPGSRADAVHVATATVARVDLLVSWNFRHIVNLGRIRRFHAVNLEMGYLPLEIRTPREVVEYGEEV